LASPFVAFIRIAHDDPDQCLDIYIKDRLDLRKLDMEE